MSHPTGLHYQGAGSGRLWEIEGGSRLSRLHLLILCQCLTLSYSTLADVDSFTSQEKLIIKI